MGVAKSALQSVVAVSRQGARAAGHPLQPGRRRSGADDGRQVDPRLRPVRGHVGRPRPARLGREQLRTGRQGVRRAAVRLVPRRPPARSSTSTAAITPSAPEPVDTRSGLPPRVPKVSSPDGGGRRDASVGSAREPARRRDVAVPPPAPRQPGRLVPVGAGGVRRGPRSATSRSCCRVGYSACHWCHVMAHECFEDDEVAAVMNATVRQHQGRPRGATRRRRHLHGRRAGDDRPRRLADDRVHDRRRAPVLRRHLLPEAQLPEADGRHRRRLAQPARRARRRTRRALVKAIGALGRDPTRPTTCPAIDAVNGALQQIAGVVRRRVGRVRTGAEVPVDDAPRARAAGLHVVGRRGRQHGRHHLARRDGVGRHVRPHRRRLRPLLGRPRVARAALREDAVRPGAARARLPPRLRRARSSAAGARSSRRRSATCCATCATPTAASTPPRTPTRPTSTATGTRACSTRGRPTRCGPCSPDRRRRRRRARVVRHHRRPATSRDARSRTGSPRVASSPARPRSRRPGGACSTPGRSGRAHGSTTRCSPSGTRCSCATLAEAAAMLRARRLAAGRDRQRRVPAPRAAATRRPVAPVAGRPTASRRPATTRSPPTTPRSSIAFTRLGRGSRAGALDRRRARRRPTSMLDHFWDVDHGGAVHDRRRRRAARRPPEGPLRQRHAVGQLDGRRSRCMRLAALTGEQRYANHADRILQLLGTVIAPGAGRGLQRPARHRDPQPWRHRGGDRRRPTRPRAPRPVAVPARRRARLGRAATTRRCGTSATRRARRTCAATTPARRRRTRRRASSVSSPGTSSRPRLTNRPGG